MVFWVWVALVGGAWLAWSLRRGRDEMHETNLHAEAKQGGLGAIDLCD